jgi:(p)ppGpp synthase/HD superfamily hydrolase
MAAEETPDPGSLSFDDHLPLTQNAVAFAADKHAGQRRRADEAPFIMHPIEAASILERSHFPDPVVAAAVLHDVIEDTEVDRSELEERFGAEVADLVAAVSDDPSIEDEEEKKDELRERVRRAGGYAAAVYAADKISKARELRILIARGANPDVIEVKQRRYRRSLAMLEEVIPNSRLVELLRFELEALETLPPQPDD